MILREYFLSALLKDLLLFRTFAHYWTGILLGVASHCEKMISFINIQNTDPHKGEMEK